MRLHHPEFPDRRAFFVETDTRLSVYAQWGDRMAEDLRHEVTHGYLHSVVPERAAMARRGDCQVLRGSARAARVEPSAARSSCWCGSSSEHWQPNLRRLEQFPPDYNMTQDDYAEAWAWVHLLMESRPE